MDEVDERAFTEFVATRGQVLLRAAYALTGEQHAAEDLVQTALAKAMLRWSKIHGNAEPYVRQILYHEYVSGWRRLWRRSEFSMADPPEPVVAVGRPADGHQTDAANLRLALRDALRVLPPRQRAVVVLRYLEDLSEQQVAEILGCTTGTVGSQASRALATLRKHVPGLIEVEATR